MHDLRLGQKLESQVQDYSLQQLELHNNNNRELSHVSEFIVTASQRKFSDQFFCSDVYLKFVLLMYVMCGWDTLGMHLFSSPNRVLWCCYYHLTTV